jgi:hypothetical protein
MGTAHEETNKSSGWRFVRLALVIFGVSTLIADSSCLREDEVDCEQAVAWLQTCCPGFAQNETVQCVYDQNTCTLTEPAISISDSHCILGEPCELLRSSGICARVQNLVSPHTSINISLGGASGGGGGLSPNKVCP